MHVIEFDAEVPRPAFNRKLAGKSLGLIKSPGEMGGQLQRASEPAFYADKLGPARTLDDKLSASGSFALTKSEGGAGIFYQPLTKIENAHPAYSRTLSYTGDGLPVKFTNHGKRSAFLGTFRK